MSNSGTLQRRTTYLISLTLVKVEAVGSDEGAESTSTKPKSPTQSSTQSPTECRSQSSSQSPTQSPNLSTTQSPNPSPTQSLTQCLTQCLTQSPTQSSPSVPGLVQGLEYGGKLRQEGKLVDAKSKIPQDDKKPEVEKEKVEVKKRLESKNGCPVRVLPPKPKIPSYPPVANVHKSIQGDPHKDPYAEDGRIKREETELSKVDTYKADVPSEKVSDLVVSNGTSVRPAVPVRLGQSALRPHATVTMNRRDFKDSSKTISSSAKNLDIKGREHSPPMTITMTMGPYRASWSESEGRGMYQRYGMEPLIVPEEGFTPTGLETRESTQVEKFKTISASLPVQAARPPVKPQRKGKSRTLDNSDLNLLSEDLKKGKDSHSGPGRFSTQAPGKDRKMLKFISGIFTKSTQCPVTAPVVPATPIPLHSPTRRRSSEEEACAVNQEWILSHAIQDLHLGVLGSLRSGKSALVHRYMTGSYLPLESPEACRFEKEVLIDGQNHILVIREEPGLPDAQLCSWVDGLILVFSLENEGSFLEVYNIYRQLCAHRNVAEIPFVVVGTQDKITSSNPRVIDDARARQLCSDVHRCVYYETCATYGLNVNRVFTDAAQKIVSMKRQLALYASCKSLPNSPSHSGGSTPISGAFTVQASNGGQSSDYSSSLPSTPVITHKNISAASGGGEKLIRTAQFTLRRGSDSDRRGAEAHFGIGRTIPIKQSVLLKRSGSSLKQEWKKKYVTLSSNGALSYHSNVSDYMQNVNGKEIDLLRVTVKIPGKRPPRAVPSSAPPPGLNGTVQNEPMSDEACSGAVLTSGAAEEGLYGQRSPFALSTVHNIDIEGVLNPTLMKDPSTSPVSDRKKQRRKKNLNQRADTTLGHAEDDENCEFLIVSSSGQTWHFEAQTVEERDSWVQNIENQILASIQSCESSRNKARRNSLSEAVALQAVRNAKGNAFCVDCDAANPTWASLNLGALICIECSGIHRNLGTHLSRVRSLDLDDWPYELALVLIAIGNQMTNSIWEKRTRGRQKPRPDSTREERELWIRAKYEQKLFLAPLSCLNDELDAPVSARLHSAVIDRDLPRLLLLLAHSTKEEINAPPPYVLRFGNGGILRSQSALHAACQLGDVVMTQLLIWYGSDVRNVDSLGQTALSLARRAGSQVCVEILLQHGCPGEISPTMSTSSITSPSGPTSPTLSRNSSSTSLGWTSTKRYTS
ncbi:arf-GAP with GTPase, ANK repeat and PH domain-containing protein 1-like isoform X2 [Trichomycterus rosablanca]|uniref:arf-GAP with GTPase, ANK repeat and PH domain-containing protein 1-like isoform X2 n=1 Tax=Trichomycterus rosablanca TaxID=2290929 RepID=UPI002F353048